MLLLFEGQEESCSDHNVRGKGEVTGGDGRRTQVEFGLHSEEERWKAIRLCNLPLTLGIGFSTPMLRLRTTVLQTNHPMELSRDIFGITKPFAAGLGVKCSHLRCELKSHYLTSEGSLTFQTYFNKAAILQTILAHTYPYCNFQRHTPKMDKSLK